MKMKRKLIENKMKKDKNPNRFLLQARKRSGLSQKTVAFLLGRKFTDEISRYEAGQRVPTVQTALKLEIIYRVPIRLLFYQAYQSCLWQIREKSGKFSETSPLSAFSDESLQDRLKEEEYCTYAHLLRTPNLPQIEKQNVYAHIRYLAKKINEVETT